MLDGEGAVSIKFVEKEEELDPCNSQLDPALYRVTTPRLNLLGKRLTATEKP